jgi:peptidoglycan/LPS O-acetylase OafA/YrhL
VVGDDVRGVFAGERQRLTCWRSACCANHNLSWNSAHMMSSKFSAYLDIVRFSAAMIVFLGHAAGALWTGRFLWQLGAYGDTCVVIFFVLSGFVIGYVCDTKELSWQPYAVNRFARLWSVVLPALALTFVIDYAGVRIAPELYLGQPWYAGDMPLLRYLASALMLQEFWHADLVPGINGPFWSLSFEALYYLVFGIAFFARSRWKWLAIGLALLAAGPMIAVLLPIWALGFYSYHLTKRLHLAPALNWLAFTLGLIMLALSPKIRQAAQTGFTILDGLVIERYIDAFGFFLNLIGAYGLCASAKPLPDKVAKAIAHIAGTTFALYLFHRPLMQMFSYLGPVDAASWQRRILVIGGTLMVVYMATPATELLRRWLRARATRLLATPHDAIVAKI